MNARIFLKKEKLREKYASFSIIFDVYLLLYIKKVRKNVKIRIFAHMLKIIK